MSLESLLQLLPDTISVIDREMISRAYHFAEDAHKGQKRASGDPYLSHCEAVSSILAEMQVPPVMIAAGLLHDTVEDTKVTLDDIRKEFGEETANLVDGVTKLTHLPHVSRADQHELEQSLDSVLGKKPEESVVNPKSRRKDLATETLRKTFLAMGEDIRVVVIKLADRLHNMRTLGFMPEAVRKRVAKETLEIFAPSPTGWVSGK